MSVSSEWGAFKARHSLPGEPSPLDRLLTITLFSNAFAQTKTEMVRSLRDMVPMLTDTEAPTKAALPWLKLAKFGDLKTGRGSLRHDANVEAVEGIEADYDTGLITLDRARQILLTAGVASALYTSPSHTPDKPRWRVLCPCSEAIRPDQRTAMVGRLQGLFVGALAAESFNLSLSYYFGHLPGATAHEVVVVEGRAIDLCTELDAGAIGRKPAPPPSPPPARPNGTPHTSGGTAYGLTALDRECEAIRTAWEGNKHHTIVKAAYSIGGLVTGGELEEGPARAALSAALEAIKPACKDWNAARRTLDRSFRDGMGRPRDVPPSTLTTTAMTDAERAEIWARCGPLLDKLRPKAALVPVAPSADIMAPGGILAAFVAHCEATAVSPQPFLALGAAICLVGALAGRKYRTVTNLRTNTYVIAVGDSGSGKDHPRQVMLECLDLAGLGRYLGGFAIASGRAITASLEQHPARLFMIDEFGDFIREVLKSNASGHKAEIAAVLKTLWSSAGNALLGTEYANQKENKRVDIRQPHAVLYASTTPGQLWSAIVGRAMSDGMMARALVFQTPVNYPDRVGSNGLPDEPPSDLLAALAAIADGADGHDAGGNLAAHMIATASATPYTVPNTVEADAAYAAIVQEQTALLRRYEGTYFTAVWGRLAEHAMKLALIRAVSTDPARPWIQVDDVAWGRAVAMHCILTLLREAENQVADNAYEASLKMALNIIRKHGPISESQMTRKGFNLNARDRADVLRTLVNDGRIVVETVATSEKGGRPTTRFRIAAIPTE